MPARSKGKSAQWTNEELARIVITLIDSISEAIQVVDQNAVTVFYSEKAAELDNLSQEGIVGRHILEVLPSTQVDANTIIGVLKTGTPSGVKEETRLLADGRILNVAESVYPAIAKGRMIGAIRIIRDITVLREVAQKLARLETALVLQASPSGSHQEPTPSPAMPSGPSTSSVCSYATGHDNVKGYSLDDLVGISPCIQDLRQKARRMAKGSWPLLLWGEHGTGKELLARIIHAIGDRSDMPIVVQRCGQFPEEMLWEMLSGGNGNGIGLMRAASGGTLVLKDVESLSPSFQARLCNMARDGAATQNGSLPSGPDGPEGRDDPNGLPPDGASPNGASPNGASPNGASPNGFPLKRVPPRIVVTAAQDPFVSVARGTLSPEIFALMNSLSMHVPPLRDRKEDIPILTEHFISGLKDRFGSPVLGVSAEVAAAFQEYPWPGNVGELRLVLESAMCMADGPMIQMEHLPPGFTRALAILKERPGAAISGDTEYTSGTIKRLMTGDHGELEKPRPLRAALQKREAEMLVQSLVKAEGNITEAARLLGMPRQTLQYRLKKLGIVPKNWSSSAK